MPGQHNDKTRVDESSTTVVGHFEDSGSAELAARAALKAGFAVQLVDGRTVSVQAGSHPQHAGEIEGILGAYGATNIPAVHSADSESPYSSTADRIRADRGGRIELIEEELEARPQPVVAGEVLVRKKVVKETVTIEVPVEREELLIERVPLQRDARDQWADTPATDPLLQALSERLRDLRPGEAVRIPIVQEEIIIQKQPVVRSELVIGKRLVREIQHFAETVRREVADVDRKGNVRIAELEEPS